MKHLPAHYFLESWYESLKPKILSSVETSSMVHLWFHLPEQLSFNSYIFLSFNYLSKSYLSRKLMIQNSFHSFFLCVFLFFIKDEAFRIWKSINYLWFKGVCGSEGLVIFQELIATFPSPGS